VVRAGSGGPGFLRVERVELEDAAGLGCPDLGLGGEGGVVCPPHSVAGEHLALVGQGGGGGDDEKEDREEGEEGGTHVNAVAPSCVVWL